MLYFPLYNHAHVTKTDRSSKHWFSETWFPFCLLENLPLPAAGETVYVPVESHAVLPKLFTTSPSDNKYVYLPAL